MDTYEECSVVAFFGLRTSRPVEFYQLVKEFCLSINAPADKLAVHTLTEHREPAAVAKEEPYLFQCPGNEIQSVSVFALDPSATIPAVHWRVQAVLSQVGDYCVVAAKSELAELENTLLSLVRELIALVRPSYGIGYQRERMRGPIGYAIGLAWSSTFSDAEMRENEEIASWNDGMRLKVYSRGILRDLYPWNFITSSHLLRTVDGVRFEEWIRQDNAHGQLLAMPDGVYLWTVNQDKANDIRTFLERVGMLFDAKQFANELQMEFDMRFKEH